ncbi:capsular exopolysaccharide synthesis family protein [Microbacteriaceae bacterium SG_E_30_P1]|uniref:Capsular exopolysaccharide synthesis family protein n=2 Tax=Antiquaquibacter oligotrophicus TaxID=2880260 RepID=A0ABT6KPD9_9MICO|nr:capsular exopolysaccharide synthesis family protein [Antiquaquibacter oligotrophicus]
MLLTLLGASGGAVYSILTTPKYQATTALFISVRTSGDSTTGELVQGNTFAQGKVKSYAVVAQSPRVLEPVIEDLNLDVSAKALAAQVSTSSPLDTTVLEITVSDGDPVMAANISNAVAASFSNVVVNQLEAPTGGQPSLVTIEPIEPAMVPEVPYLPNTRVNLVLGFLVGLALGLGAAILRHVLDTRIHGPQEVQVVTEAPVLGGIGFDPEAKKRPLIVHADPRSSRAESFRALRTNLQFVQLDSGPRVFVVTSSVPGEGKTTTTANLAIALAETGARVAVVDGDLRRPALADYMGLEGAVGLTDVLIGRADLKDVLQKWGRNDLFVLPAGRIPPNPSELLGSAGMAKVIAELGKTFNFVLIDAPPLLPVTDAAVLSKFTTGAIVIVAAGRTKRTELAAALRSFEHIESKVLGVVLTMLPTKGPDSYGYGNYYGGYSDVDTSKPQLKA